MDNEARIKQLEEDLNLAYDNLDQRVSILEENQVKQSDYIAIFGIVASIVIGVVQIIVTVLK